MALKKIRVTEKQQIAIAAIAALVIVFCIISMTSGPRPSPVRPGDVSGEISGDIAEPLVPSDDKTTEVSPDKPVVPSDDAGLSRDLAEGPGVLVVIDKSSHTLLVMRDGKQIRRYGIAVGKNTGDKRKVGDMRTPEGTFPISQIQNATSWTHDFGDGKGQIRGAYGPLFIRLATPKWKGIGIHGTHDPASIGTNATEGCIRLKNEDLLEFRKLVKLGDKVVIKH